MELGKSEETDKKVRAGIESALGGSDEWVLIGGPPCQAYSLVGRVKNSSLTNYDPKGDNRFVLYRSFLEIAAAFRPSIFIMENVKGLLSASLGDQPVFEKMLEELQSPRKALGLDQNGVTGDLGYSLYPIVTQDASIPLLRNSVPRGFIVKAEDYGIPQARHRIVVVGVRSDIGHRPIGLKKRKPVCARAVLEGLPRIRSGLSKGTSEQDQSERVSGSRSAARARSGARIGGSGGIRGVSGGSQAL